MIRPLLNHQINTSNANGKSMPFNWMNKRINTTLVSQQTQMLSSTKLPMRTKSYSQQKLEVILAKPKKSKEKNIIPEISESQKNRAKLSGSLNSIINGKTIKMRHFKTEILTRKPTEEKLKISSIKTSNFHNSTKLLNKNNSSCIFSDTPPLFNKIKHPDTLSKGKEIPNEQEACHVSNPQSIFKIFRQKLNNFRSKMEDRKDEVKIITKDLTVEKVNDTCTKDFLMKLFKECKNLNGNIIRLYSDTTRLNSKIKDINSFKDLFDCTQNTKRQRSRSVINDKYTTGHFNNCKTDNNDRSISEFLTTKQSCVIKEKQNDNYYHLACVLSSEQDLFNDGTKSKITELERTKVTKTCGYEEITNISPIKFTSVHSDDASLQSDFNECLYNTIKNDDKKHSNKENKNRNHLEFDDTLCDVDYDDDMETESLRNIDDKKPSDVPVKWDNLIAITSPKSDSNYVTADEPVLQTIKMGGTNELDYSCSVTHELPPHPTMVNDLSLTNKSFPNIEPPLNEEKSVKETRFVSIFEKQFQPEFIVPNNGSSDCIDFLSNYTSTITINCKSKQSQNPFNPFKPPKCFGTNNNWKSTENIENSNNSNINNYDYFVIKSKNKRRRGHYFDYRFKDMNTNQNNDTNNDKEQVTVENKLPSRNYLALPEVVEEEAKRVAPLKQLMMHSRVSEQMSDIISNQKKEERISPTANSYIEKQRQKKIDRQKEQHQKAKEMAVEAARLRKERQAEMQTFDSQDSSRIANKLFKEPDESDYPAYSLFDAINYNFNRRRQRRQIPTKLVESKIKGILPEPDSESPEPEKGPVTTEEFRSQPLEFAKIEKKYKKYTDEDLIKYQPVTNFKPPPIVKPKKEETESIIEKSMGQQNISNHIDMKALQILKSSSSNSSRSSSESVIKRNSLITYSNSSSSSSTSLSSSISVSSLSSSSTPTPIVKPKSKYKKTKPKPPKTKHSKTKTSKIKSAKKVKKEIKEEILNETSTDNTEETEPSQDIEVANLDNTETSEGTRFKGVKFEDIFIDKDRIKKKNIMKSYLSKDEREKEKEKQKKEEEKELKIKLEKVESTEKIIIGAPKPQSSCETQTNFENNYTLEDDFEFIQNSIPPICHLNYQKTHNTKYLDRTLPLVITIPNPDTSLSSFVQEIINQLTSLSDTVDILLNRMDIMEANLLDCTKYFITE